jgi:hypothetical protein
MGELRLGGQRASSIYKSFFALIAWPFRSVEIHIPVAHEHDELCAEEAESVAVRHHRAGEDLKRRSSSRSDNNLDQENQGPRRHSLTCRVDVNPASTTSTSIRSAIPASRLATRPTRLEASGIEGEVARGESQLTDCDVQSRNTLEPLQRHVSDGKTSTSDGSATEVAD